MTWEEFKEQVEELCPIDMQREGMRLFFPAQLIQGVVDIQEMNPRFREGHTTTFSEEDLTEDGEAQYGDMPSGIKQIDEIILQRSTTNSDDIVVNTKHPAVIMDWEQRHKMIDGTLSLDDNNARIAIDKRRSRFYVFPQVLDDQDISGTVYDGALVMEWDGIKHEFEDEDEVPFDIFCVRAVAAWLKLQIAVELDKDVKAAGLRLSEYQRALRQMRRE